MAKYIFDKSTTIRVGSFNLKNLGASATTKNSKRNLKMIADIIRKYDFDVIALQEVRGNAAAFYSNKFDENNSRVSSLDKHFLFEYLGNEWKFNYAIAEPDGVFNNRHEECGFLYKPSRLKFMQVESKKTGNIRTAYPQMCNIRNGLLTRRPYYARFTPTLSPNIELRLLAIHNIWGSSQTEREKEMNIILKEIYPQIFDRPSEKNYIPYTIILGDYNLNIYNEHESTIYANGKTPNLLVNYNFKNGIWIKDSTYNRTSNTLKSDYWHKDLEIKTVQNRQTTLKNKNNIEELNNKGREGYNGYANSYDHFSFNEKKFIDNGIGLHFERIRAPELFYQGDDKFEKYKNEVSDHVPIFLDIVLRK